MLSPDLSSSLAPEPLTLGVTLHINGTASFRVWAPHAASVFLRLKEGYKEVQLNRDHDNFDMWSLRLAPGALSKGAAYKVLICTHDGQKLERRDPYAHQTEYSSEWCFVDDPSAFPWSPHILRPFEENIIYEMHVGSFTPVGTLAAAMEKLEYIQQLGFTQVQLMPLTEHSDAWGYNPRQLLSLHGGFGTPDDLRRFVDRAHQLKMGVIVDVVLHHGAVEVRRSIQA